jgi:tetratricopeptide (TPR) repeat protein
LDSEARLLMAEAYVKDDASTIPVRERVEAAIIHLQQIGDDRRHASMARLQEARLRLLILHQPARAERLLHQSLQLDPDSHDANLLMWRLLDITGRHTQSGPYFWKAYGLSSAVDRPGRLREWFFAEFFPGTANLDYDQVLSTRATDEMPASIQRFLLFRDAEHDSPANHAAVARYFLVKGNPQHALKMLRRATDLSGTLRDPFYVRILFETLMELGEYEKAKICFDKWPGPPSGFDYWRCKGMFHEKVLQDYAAACRAYETALKTGPGKVDWSVMMRLVHCLRQTGNTQRAERLQQRVNAIIRELLTNENLASIKSALLSLDNPGAVALVRDFYKSLRRDREAREWESYRLQLKNANPLPFPLGSEIGGRKKLEVGGGLMKTSPVPHRVPSRFCFSIFHPSIYNPPFTI